MVLNKLEKQISLRILNACSIGRVRSYITKGVSPLADDDIVGSV